jgi:hypothetical protein
VDDIAREYSFTKEFTNPTAVTQLQIAAGTAMPLVIMRAWITQRTSTTSTAVGAQLRRKTAAATVTAAVLNTDIRRLDPGDSGSSVQLGTALSGYTASAEGTDGEIIVEEGFNILNGWYYEPQPELRPTVPGGGIIALKLATAITGTVEVGIQFAEGLSG